MRLTESWAPRPALLALTRRPMRGLTPVSAGAPLTVFPPRPSRTLRRAVALQLRRAEPPWHLRAAREPRAAPLLRRVCRASARPQDGEPVRVLVDSPPQGRPRTLEGEKHRIHVPRGAGPRPPGPAVRGGGLPQGPTPWAERFVGPGAPACAQEGWHVALAQGDARVKPDAMPEDCTGNAVVLVTLGVDRRGPGRLPIRGGNGAWRGHRRGQLGHGSGRMVNKLTKPTCGTERCGVCHCA